MATIEIIAWSTVHNDRDAVQMSSEDPDFCCFVAVNGNGRIGDMDGPCPLELQGLVLALAGRAWPRRKEGRIVFHVDTGDERATRARKLVAEWEAMVDRDVPFGERLLVIAAMGVEHGLRVADPVLVKHYDIIHRDGHVIARVGNGDLARRWLDSDDGADEAVPVIVEQDRFLVMTAVAARALPGGSRIGWWKADLESVAKVAEMLEVGRRFPKGIVLWNNDMPDATYAIVDNRPPTRLHDSSATYDRILVDPDPLLAADGWRLHILRPENEGNVSLERERVLPEKVADLAANNVFESDGFWMGKAEMVWLRDRLNELIGTDDTKGAR